MRTRITAPAVLLLLAASHGIAQTCSSTATTGDLICALPQLFGPGGLTLTNPNHFAHFQSASLTTFTPLSKGIGEELSTLPLGSAGGGINISFNAQHAPVTTVDSLGPILTERADVIGKKRLDVGVVYQYFNFTKIDGVDLKNFPAVLGHAQFQVNGTTPSYENDYIVAANDVNMHLHQIVAYGIYGLTSRLDVSAEIPIEHIDFNVTSNDQLVRTVACELTATCVGGGANFGEYHYFGTPTSNAGALSGVSATFGSGGGATGIGDVVLRGKFQAIRAEKLAGSVGLDLRLPSGNERNFLGSGAVGVAPFGALTYKARVSPHARLGYQWNGSSVLAADPTSATSSKASLPPGWLYSAGADFRLVDRVTVAADLIGERVLGASRLNIGSFTDYTGKSTPAVESYTGDYSSDSIAIGVKARIKGELIAIGNVTIRVNSGGLTARAVPLVGLSYAF